MNVILGFDSIYFDGKPMLSKGDSKNVGAVEAHKTNDECKTNKRGAKL